jgi:hypothetical protein
VGSVLTFPSSEGFADRILDPNECVTVTYRIGLATSDKFDFIVDVVGQSVEPPATAQAIAAAQGTDGSNKKEGNPASIALLRIGD